MTRYLLLFVCIFSQFNLIAQKKKVVKNVIIRGHITQTSEYCGGAVPSPQTLASLETPAPLAQKSIFIKIGSTNSGDKPVFKKVVTDDNGDFKISLKPGLTYSFVEEWKSGPMKYPANTEFVKYDHQCYSKEYSKPDFVLKVKKAVNPIVKINYFNPCFFHPFCGEYSGPLPP